MNTDTMLAATGSRVKVEEAGTGRRIAFELVEAGKNLAERIAARLGREDQDVRILLIFTYSRRRTGMMNSSYDVIMYI